MSVWIDWRLRTSLKGNKEEEKSNNGNNWQYSLDSRETETYQNKTESCGQMKWLYAYCPNIYKTISQLFRCRFPSGTIMLCCSDDVQSLSFLTKPTFFLLGVCDPILCSAEFTVHNCFNIGFYNRTIIGIPPTDPHLTCFLSFIICPITPKLHYNNSTRTHTTQLTS